MKRNYVAKLCVGLMLILLLANSCADKEVDPLVGTWEITVDVGVPGAPPVIGLITFNQSGTLTENNELLHANSASFDPFCGCNAGDGHGVWSKTGPNVYAFTFKKLMYSSDRTKDFTLDLSNPLVKDGQLIGFSIIKATDLTVDGDSFTGKDTADLVNLDGQPLNPGLLPGPVPQTLSGKRITLDD